MNNTRDNTRNLNIEILRFFLMFVILFHHFFSHGLHVGNIGTEEFPFTIENNVNASLCLLTHFGVIGFMFISSYYGITFKVSKAIKLWLQLFFYSFLIVICFFIISHSFSSFQLIQSFFPLRIWWFVKFYFLVLLLSPIINSGINNINKRLFSLIVITIGSILFISRFIFNDSSFNLDLLLYVYILGRYLRLYPLNWLEKNSGLIFLITSIVLFCLPLLLLHFKISTPLHWLWSSYNFLVLLEAISCFYTFLYHKIFSFHKLFYSISSANVLSVYLITDHPLIRSIIWSDRNGMTFLYYKTGSLFLVILVLMVIMAICIVFDKIRVSISKPLDNLLVNIDRFII